jgi:hypothetical protein
MKTYYDSEAMSISVMTPGKYYAVFDSEWHRVRCIKFDAQSQEATIFFIDRGDEDVFPIGRARALHSKFCQLPSQAVRFSMAGLEIFHDCDETYTLLEDLLIDKDVFVRCLNKDQKHPDTLSAQLYLEKEGKEINANELLQNEIIKNVLDPNIYIKPVCFSSESRPCVTRNFLTRLFAVQENSKFIETVR